MSRVEDNNQFLAFLKQQLPVVDNALRDAFKTSSAPHPDLYEYLYHPLESYSTNAGKRIRPIICMIATRAFGGSIQEVLPLAVALENFQTAALIHDDIADESDTRRGLPCMHIIEGEGIAINCGDVALASVMSEVLHMQGLDDARKFALLSELDRMIKRTMEGQALDLGWARDERWDIAAEDYFVMASLKTAYYSCASPLVLGALFAGVQAEVLSKLESFGVKVGIVFQIQDDLLNLFGSVNAMGKDYRSDITEGKRTLLVIEALSRLRQKDKARLIEILSSRTSEQPLKDEACELIVRSGAYDAVSMRAKRLLQEALRELEDINLDEQMRNVLIDMGRFFLDRNK